MPIPNIAVTERDGQLGAVSVSTPLIALVGESAAGTNNVPVLVTKLASLISTFTSGDLVEEGAELVARGVRFVAVKVADDTSITAALDALKASSQPITAIYFLGDTTSAMAAVLDSFCEDMLEEQNRRMQWYGNTRMFTTGPDEAVSAYITAMTTVANSFTTVFGSVATGQLWTNSRVTGTAGYAPFSRFYVAQEMRNDLDENSAELRFPLPNCSAFDEDGNLRSQVYLENLHGGLGTLKLVTPRTWPQRGTNPYVTAPYIHSGTNSDFKLTNHRAVMNLARVVAYDALSAQLNAALLVSATTGKILESEAVRIERTVEAALEIALLGKPYASGVEFIVDRETNLLVDGAVLETTCNVVPLKFTDQISISIGFTNPATEVV